MFKLSLRNVLRNYRRFGFLVLAIGLAFMIVTLIQGLIGGMLGQLNSRGARYYGGQVIVAGYQQPGGTEALANQTAILATIDKLGLMPSAVSVRTQYMSGNGSLSAQGQALNMRRIIGLDYSRESQKIGQLEFSQGGIIGLSRPDGVLISDVVAKRLEVKLGDDLTMRLRQSAGRLDEARLVVGGIFHEASILGYFTAYMDRAKLNNLMGRPAGDATNIGIYLDDYRQADNVKRRLQSALVGQVDMFPPLGNQIDYQKQRSTDYHGIKHGVLTSSDYMYEIQTLVGALTWASLGLLILIFGVIAIGIANTYRVLMYERVQEIGTMRALGMQQSGVRNLVLGEAIILSVVGIVGGLVLGLIGLMCLTLISLPNIPGLDILLIKGHLDWTLAWDTVLVDALLVSFIALVGAWGPARRAAATVVVDALRTE